MKGRRLCMRRLFASLAVLLLAALWAGSPAPGKAACASTATLEQSAQEPGVAIFTGRATGVTPGSGDVVFAVDRWFDGPHAARVASLLAPYAYIVEPPTAGVIRATLANVTSGEAISLVRDQQVLMVAVWVPGSEAWATQACSIAGVPLDSAEGACGPCRRRRPLRSGPPGLRASLHGYPRSRQDRDRGSSGRRERLAAHRHRPCTRDRVHPGQALAHPGPSRTPVRALRLCPETPGAGIASHLAWNR